MTKEQEREELHRTIKQIANDLRGPVDGWDFKAYVLGFLFYRFISENLTTYLNEEERRTGIINFDYTRISDQEAEFGRADTIKEKGYYILPSELFINVRKRAKDDPNLNVTITSIFDNIENSAKGFDSESDLKGLFDDIDVNSNKLGPSVVKRVEKLVKILDAIGELKLGDFKNNAIDTFGDAYEYLMTMYASDAGKSGGEFFTPQEVSELLAEIAVCGKKEVNKVYDPACGSGSLLLKFAKVLGKDNVRQGFYGQEVNITTYNLCRINMFLHDVNFEKFDIALGDTLIDPKHWDDEPFDAIVSNPPYSLHWDGKDNPLLINDPRFSPAGVLAPKGFADLAFTMHMLSWLSISGTAAIVEFPGVLERGRAEQKIRRYLIDNNYIDTVIQLPPDLFFGTSIATCIIVLKKSKNDNSILFIDASTEFVHEGNKNKLSDSNRKHILRTYAERKEEANFSRVVTHAEIADNDYIIAVSSYVVKEDIIEEIDIEHLNSHITEIVIKQNQMRDEIDEIVKNLERTQELLAPYKLDGKWYMNGKAVEWKTMGEIGSFVRGNGLQKKDFVESGVGCIHYGQIHTYYGTYTYKTKTYVSIEHAKKLRKAKKGDIVIATTSEDVEGVCKAVAWLGEDEIAVGGDAYIFSHNQNPKYISYLFKTKMFYEYKKKNVTGAKVVRVSGNKMAKFKIPLPPLDEQERIVSILDKFDELVNNMSMGLPAEIEARRKQYEYYKEKLLHYS